MEKGVLKKLTNKRVRLIQEKNLLTKELMLVEKKNSLLTDVIDLDYLEILYREKFMVGKSNEKIYNYKY